MGLGIAPDPWARLRVRFCFQRPWSCVSARGRRAKGLKREAVGFSLLGMECSGGSRSDGFLADVRGRNGTLSSGPPVGLETTLPMWRSV